MNNVNQKPETIDPDREPITYLSRFGRIPFTHEWIEKHRLRLSRTPEEVGHQMMKANGAFEFDNEVYLQFIDDKVACTITRELWNKDVIAEIEAGASKFTVTTTLVETVQDFLDYMSFAWGKAEDERGISASRSIQKLGAWLWILGRDDLHALINQENLYCPYGVPALQAVCRELEIPWPKDFVMPRA